MRGRRHIEELIRIRKLGFEASIVFIIQRKAKVFKVNRSLDPRLADSLKRAEKEEVRVYAYGVAVDPQGYKIAERIPASIE